MTVLTGEQPFQPAVCLAAETNGYTPGGGQLYWAPEHHCAFPRAVPEPDAWFFHAMHFSSVASLLILCAFEFSRTVPPGQSITFQMKCTPVKSGPKKFIVKFTSRQVKEVHAEKIILITK